MIKNNRIDTSAWISIGVLVFLALFAELNHFVFTEYVAAGILFYSLVVIISGFVMEGLRQKFPRMADILFGALVALYLYRIWPHMFFDDAGFIMRYLDNLNKGYWFQYNPGEGAVFGISGFVHGLFCSLLVKFSGMQAERALHISNLAGLAATAYFLAGIFRVFVQRAGLAYLAAFIVVCFTKTWCDVLFTGMETPLHVALVVGAFYYLLVDKTRYFYLFASLAVISKLDAVPVMGVLLLLHVIHRINDMGLAATFRSELKPALIFFALPLLTWYFFATWLFGSPFPQSAKAKMLYHSGANDAIFPFLEGFSNDIYKHPMLWLLLALFVFHLLYIRKKGLRAVTVYFGFGWMFIGIMALYYFYNPNERMLWYYALPELLLVGQCLLSTVWLATESKDWKRHALPVFVVLGWLLYLKPDVDGGRNWMFSYLEKVERERYEVGKYIAPEGSESDTLVAWHGLIARPFPGFVLDGTGLNSRLAVDFKLNRDSMLSVINPRYGIHHGYPHINKSFAENGYRIKGMFADVTLENWPAWIWWEKTYSGTPANLLNEVFTLADTTVLVGKVTNPANPLRAEGRNVIFNIPDQGRQGNFWFALEGRGTNDSQVNVKLWKDTLVADELVINVPAYGKSGYPSLYTYGTNIAFQGCTKIEFIPTGEDTVVKINNPVIEYVPVFYDSKEK